MHIKKNKTFWLHVEFSLVMQVVHGDQSWRAYGDPQVQNNTTSILKINFIQKQNFLFSNKLLSSKSNLFLCNLNFPFLLGS